jgi:hypothetical protein
LKSQCRKNLGQAQGREAPASQKSYEDITVPRTARNDVPTYMSITLGRFTHARPSRPHSLEDFAVTSSSYDFRSDSSSPS